MYPTRCLHLLLYTAYCNVVVNRPLRIYNLGYLQVKNWVLLFDPTGVQSEGLYSSKRDKYCERARWIKSYAVIGCRSGQDGAILPTCDYPPCPARKIFPKKPYKKSFIGHSLLSQDGWILAQFFCCEFMDLHCVSVDKHETRKEKELSQFPAILTSPLVNNPYIANCYSNRDGKIVYLQHMCN